MHPNINYTLLFLTFISIIILATDIHVLKSAIKDYFELEDLMPKNSFNTCYKPQSEMRVVFQCYAIFCAMICTILSTSLAIGLSEKWIEAIAKTAVNTCYLMFGPVLLTFTNLGFSNIWGIAFICDLNGRSNEINFGDLMVLGFALGLSLLVTFYMLLKRTVDMANTCLQDENSLVYKMASFYFNYQA